MVEFGIVSLGDIQADPATGRPVPTATRIDDIVGYARLADRLGLDVFALGEHHTLDFAVSSPAVVLATIAARTSRIRLTSAVTVLPVLDPVRVYQDFATLDLVSDGRAELIVGRSAFTEPFDIFGVSLDDYDALFAEKLELLLQLRDTERVSWSGRFRPPLHDAPITPRAQQSPLPVSVGVGGTPASAQRAGRLGLPMVIGFIGGPIDAARDTVAIYRAAAEQAGHDPARLGVGVSTHLFAGADPAAAQAVYPYYHEYLRPKRPGGRGFEVSPAQFAAGTARGQQLMVGSTDELIDKIVTTHRTLGIDRFIGQVDWGGLPRALVAESIERYATQIVPAVRAAISPVSA